VSLKVVFISSGVTGQTFLFRMFVFVATANFTFALYRIEKHFRFTFNVCYQYVNRFISAIIDVFKFLIIKKGIEKHELIIR